MDYIVGVDFARDYTQVCLYNRDRGTVDSVPLSGDRQSTRIKTAITFSKEQNDWLVYSPVHDKNPSMHVVGNLYELVEKGEGVSVFGEEYKYGRLFSRFLRRLMFAVNRECQAKDIKGITITLKKKSPELIKHISEGLEYFGVPKERYKICDHIESFMYFVVMQDRDIWINDVGLFSFDEDEFRFCVLRFGRKQKPISIVAESTDYSDTVRYEMLNEEDDIRIKYAFENLCDIMLHKQSISAIYATGAGFDGAWADGILKKLSSGRRIFRGMNLYVKGSAYASKLFFEGGSEDYLVIGEDTLKSSIALRAVSRSQTVEIPFGKVGQSYTEAGGSAEVILDNTNEIDFVLHNVLKKDSFCAIMTLDAMPVRKNKTNRFSVKVRFPSRNAAVVTVKDMGFGAVRETDYRIWEQVINL